MDLSDTFTQLKGSLWQEFSFIKGSYRILVTSWMIMDIATEMPQPNFQYYVEALGGPPMALGLIGLANFLGMAAMAFPGGYLAASARGYSPRVVRKTCVSIW